MLCCRDQLDSTFGVSTLHTTWTSGSPSTLRVSPNAARSRDDDARLAQPRLLSIKEIASACQLSEKAVRRAIEDGELIAVKLRSRLRVTPQDFEAWLISSQRRRDRDVISPLAGLPRRAAAGTFRALIQDDRGASR